MKSSRGPDLWRTRGYFFVVDADGAEVPGTRRKVDTSTEHAHALSLWAALEGAMGPDCYVVFRET